MTDKIYLRFNQPVSEEYPSTAFFFLGARNRPGTYAAGDFQWSRAINKNLTTINLPIKSYDGGGVGLDIGMAEDTFELRYITYSYDEYRWLAMLGKIKSGMSLGDLHFEVQGHSDVFSVALKNVQFNFPKGEGFACEIKLSLMVVNPELADKTHR